MSVRAAMLEGRLYNPSDPELVAARARATDLLRLYNATGADEGSKRRELLEDLLGNLGEAVWLEPPFHCDYGSQIFLGDGVYLNTGCVFLDCARIEVGAGALLGPGVHLYAATHPTDPSLRRQGLELARPVTIGEDVWIGGGAIVCPGVVIGPRTTIGAGSVVVSDIPEGVVAAGNPCRVLRRLEADS